MVSLLLVIKTTVNAQCAPNAGTANTFYALRHQAPFQNNHCFILTSTQNTFCDTHLRISWYHNTLQNLYTKHYFHRQQPAGAILTNQASVSISGDGSFAYNPADRVRGEISHARLTHVTNGRHNLHISAAAPLIGG